MPKRPLPTPPSNAFDALEASSTLAGGDLLLAAGEVPEDGLAPHLALAALNRHARAADNLLSHLMEDAIDSMLAGGTASAGASPPPLAQGLLEPEADQFGATLSPAEAAALAGEIEPSPAGLSGFAAIDSPAFSAMPTDEELAALFEGMPGEPETVLGEANASSAAMKVAAELDADPLAHEHDADTIQADLAIEARAGVNRLEPPAHGHASLSITPAAKGRKGRPLEPIGARPPRALRSQPPPRPNRPPVWLTPLVWMNAPLFGAGKTAREAVGKAALLGLLNATAILLYILIVRH